MFRLCLAVGCPHPRYLKKYLHAADIRDWLAYSRIEPFGAQHHELLNAITAATIANCHRGKDDPVFEVTEFMPNYDLPVQSWQSIMASVREWKEVTGAGLET